MVHFRECEKPHESMGRLKGEHFLTIHGPVHVRLVAGIPIPVAGQRITKPDNLLYGAQFQGHSAHNML
jgi:hypothetical protein